jgi:quinoprotein glucose dehydrogenase
MASDPERDLLFVPTGNPAPDAWRGAHADMDHYGSSLVALRGSTGEVVWRFQTVHHDLWDYDVPAQPTLVELVRDGARVPALVQATKMGLLFVLQRETGEPIFGAQERPVPQGGAPGERLSPTQPFPLAPPPLVPHTVPPERAFGLTPFDRRACRKALAEVRNEGIYTPPGLEWALLYPAATGGMNWGGVGVDPDRRWLVVNTIDIALKARLVPRAEFDLQRPERWNPDNGPQRGTPYGAQRALIASPLGLPCSPPPWGRLTAVDLDSGEVRWERPLGTLRDVVPFPIPFDVEIGLPNLGGPLVTRSGLVFIGAAVGAHFRAFDLATGEELWRTRLRAGAHATPMTYRVEDAPPGPRQFVVVAAGGHAGLHLAAGSDLDDLLVAFALPVERTE